MYESNRALWRPGEERGVAGRGRTHLHSPDVVQGRALPKKEVVIVPAGVGGKWRGPSLQGGGFLVLAREVRNEVPVLLLVEIQLPEAVHKLEGEREGGREGGRESTSTSQITRERQEGPEPSGEKGCHGPYREEGTGARGGRGFPPCPTAIPPSRATIQWQSQRRGEGREGGRTKA